MSIAKTTRPHLLTREAAAARIEKLEARNEALETALRVIIDEPDGCVSPSFKALAATALAAEQDR